VYKPACFNRFRKDSKLAIKRENNLKKLSAVVSALLVSGIATADSTNTPIKMGDLEMKYTLTVKGSKPKEGFPLYIALHGGGGAPKAVNDGQWQQMGFYYLQSVKTGVYVATRGIRDTWNTHFNDESYPLYDTLIRHLIAEHQVDPNRVYLLGYSAGGDGVYQITPRMADRFAAVNMSAGHHNGVSLINVCNVPFALQMGEKDAAYQRNESAVAYNKIFDDLEKAFPSHYIHTLFLHAGKPHNFLDNHPKGEPQAVIINGQKITKNTNAIDWLSAFTRDPYPALVRWDLSLRSSLRTTKAFYWLETDGKTGRIEASLDRASRTITLTTENVTEPITILLNKKMLSFDAPLTIVYNNQKQIVQPTVSAETQKRTLADRGDPFYQFDMEVKLTSNLKP
jgi:dienelactone hydrolase